eukprot:c24741_g1_i2 orf=1-1797(-)
MQTKELFSLLIMQIIVAFFVAFLFRSVQGDTNQADTAALQNLFVSLNSPSQLSGWSGKGGDPCGQSWKGVRCSGSAVTQITLSGLGLNGTSLGYMLTQLTSVTVLDLSNNNISGGVPYQLPPNLEKLNLAHNSFSNGNIPYSISTMINLTYLNASSNQFSGTIVDAFQKLSNITTLDLSFNSLTGFLPQSFSSLFSLSTLYLQNNQLSGDLNVLANLPLQDLNVENNHFTGWVPSSFSSIPNLKDGGNDFNTSPAPPPPPYTPPPPLHRGHGGTSNGSGDKNSSLNSKAHGHMVLNGGAIAGIVIAGILAAIVAVLIVMFFFWKTEKEVDEEKQEPAASVLAPLTPPPLIKVVKEKPEPKAKSSSPEVVLKPPPAEKYKAQVERSSGRKMLTRRAKSPIVAITYTVADLQLATNSFSQESLVGAGALGRVYRAEMANGKVLAVKKIDTLSSSSMQVERDEDFVEVVSNISRLRHANICELVGYCMEHGQRLLVYEYFGKGTLHDILHSSDDTGIRELTWNVRVKIALGTARALEYLHEVCLPPVVHKNFKSANILLDDDLNPQLSDCGIAAFFPSLENQVSTQMLGSFGYSAPEYAMSG